MTTDQKDRLNMFLKVQTFLINNVASLAALPIISSLQTELVAITNGIINAEGQVSDDISGNTELKQQRKDAVKLQGLKVARAATLYYTLNPDPVKLRKIDLLKSELDSLRDTDLYVRIKQLFELCDPVKALLQAPDFTAADVMNLEVLNLAYFAVLEAPQDARSARSSFNSEADRQLAKGQALLDTKLDVAMNTFEAANKQLHDYYVSSRKIDSTGSRTELSGYTLSTFTIAGNSSIAFGQPPAIDYSIYIANNGPSSIVICETALATDSCVSGKIIAPDEEYLGNYSGMGIGGGSFVVITNTGSMQVTIRTGVKGA